MMNEQVMEIKVIDFKKYTSIELLVELKRLVQTERKLTQIILELINEIEFRKLHLEKGYSSLFDFLTLEMGYSPASAQRRIDGARLLQQVPEVGHKLEQGHLNLSQVSLLQKALRSYQKETNQKVNLEQKKILLEKIEMKSLKKSELILAQELNLSVPTSCEKSQIHRDESQSLTMHFSKEEMKELELIRDLKTQVTKGLDYKSLILHLVRKELKKYEKPQRQTKKIKPEEGKVCSQLKKHGKQQVHYEKQVFCKQEVLGKQEIFRVCPRTQNFPDKSQKLYQS